MASTDVLICPDCGGVIGATRATEHGKPCTCFSRSNSTADTVDEPELQVDYGAGSERGGPEKRCCQCGKDVRGHTRFKDSLGYWCKDCHKADKKRSTATETRCPDCGRMKPIDKMQLVKDQYVCQTCAKVRAAEAKKVMEKMAIEHIRRKHETRGLKMMLIIAGVLVAVLIAGWLLR